MTDLLPSSNGARLDRPQGFPTPVLPLLCWDQAQRGPSLWNPGWAKPPRFTGLGLKIWSGLTCCSGTWSIGQWLSTHSLTYSAVKLSSQVLGALFHFERKEKDPACPPVGKTRTKTKNAGTSLVAQWLRIRLPMQGTRVRALVREDPTCRGATKPVRHNYWACTLEPGSHNYWSLCT